MCTSHEFKFNLARAYRDQALEQFDKSPRHPLREHEAPGSYGVYALYLKSSPSPVYVGKATSNIRARLDQHAAKIAGRRNIDLDDVSCRYLVIAGEGEEWVAAAVENQLIAYFRPDWNGSGFGSKTPGAGRPGIRKSRWDTKYPKR